MSEDKKIIHKKMIIPLSEDRPETMTDEEVFRYFHKSLKEFNPENHYIPHIERKDD